MSHIFYDHLIVLDQVDKTIKESTESAEEREELWQIVDEIVHHKALGCILDNLPKEYHQEFLEKFHKAPHDTELMVYLNQKVGQNIEEVLRQELGNLTFEILKDIKSSK